MSGRRRRSSTIEGGGGSAREEREKDNDKDKETLLDALLPSPPHPLAARRATSLGIVSIFLLLVIWLALSSSGSSSRAIANKGEMQNAIGRLQGWVYGDSQSQPQGGTAAQAADKIPSSNGTYVLGQAAQDDEQEQEDAQDAEEDDNQADEDDQEEQEDDETYSEYAAHDLSKYVWHEDLPWDVEEDGRLIVIGDVHGMVDSVREMLSFLSYKNTTEGGKDTLVFAGDLVAKHPNISKSLETVDYIRSLNAYAVRGNHDQDVINWLSFFSSSSSFATLQDPDDASTSPPADMPHALKGKWRNEHYRIARALSPEAALWLINRTLTLHIRSLHTYVVHAGLLPWTVPKNIGKKKGHRKAADKELEEALDNLDFSNEFRIIPGETSLLHSARNDSFEPIVSSVTTTSSLSASKAKPQLAPTKLDPEIALLMVPVNRDPFTLLEMRSVKKNGKVTKNSKKGTAWAEIWNAVMGKCQETYLSEAEAEDAAEVDARKARKHRKRQSRIESEAEDELEADDKKGKNKKKPKRGQCRPLSVIYGHAAGRGLDLHPFSFGLDSGCVYGRSLSALVVEGKQYDSKTDDSSSAEKKKNKKKRVEETAIEITGHRAKVFSLKCDKPHA